MEFRKLATEIAKREGKKSESQIGNVREQLKITLSILAEMPLLDLTELLKKYRGKKSK